MSQLTPEPKNSVPSSVDLLALVKDGRHFAENKGNKVHIIDSLTGKTVAILSNPNDNMAISSLSPVTLDDGSVVLVQDSGDTQLVTNVSAYNPLVLDLLCQKIAEGGNITEICKEPGMPSYTILCRWRRAYPEVGVAIDNARRDRAEAVRDKAIRKIEDIQNEVHLRDIVPAAALMLDATKWTAGVDNEKYNPKQKVEANINVPTQIIVQTGINRE